MKIFLIKKRQGSPILYHTIRRVTTSLWRMCLLTEKEGKENKREATDWEKVFANHIHKKRLVLRTLERTFNTQEWKTIR